MPLACKLPVAERRTEKWSDKNSYIIFLIIILINFFPENMYEEKQKFLFMGETALNYIHLGKSSPYKRPDKIKI